MNNGQNLDDFKEFISNWSDKKIAGAKFDGLFTIEGTPLSWFYRPILYSSLLPRPFLTVSDILAKKKISSLKIKISGFFLRRYVVINDWIKSRIIRKKVGIANRSEKILFLNFTTYFNKDPKSDFRMGGLIQKIEESGTYHPLLLLADPLSSLSLIKIRDHSPTVYQYYDKNIIERSKKEATSLSRRWKALAEKEKKELLRFFPHAAGDLYPYVKPSLDFLYSPEFIMITWKYYLTFRKIIAQEKIAGMVLSSQNNIIEKCLIAAASHEKVPVLVIQHGLGLGTLRSIDTPHHVKFVVFSEKYKQELAQLGVDRNNISVAGPLIFDEIAPFLQQERKKNERPHLVLATSPFIEDRFMEKEVYFKKIRKIIGDIYAWNPHTAITIKLHPREKNKREYERIIQEAEKSAVVTKEVNRTAHFTLIHGCDLLITFGSTVALEGMILQKPTLTIELFDENNPTNKLIIESGASPVIKYDQDLPSAIRSSLNSLDYQHKAKKFVQELCHKIDGKASQRIVDFIYKEIENKENRKE